LRKNGEQINLNIINGTLVLCGEHVACDNTLKLPQFWNKEVIFRCK